MQIVKKSFMYDAMPCLEHICNMHWPYPGFTDTVIKLDSWLIRTRSGSDSRGSNVVVSDYRTLSDNRTDQLGLRLRVTLNGVAVENREVIFLKEFPTDQNDDADAACPALQFCAAEFSRLKSSAARSRNVWGRNPLPLHAGVFGVPLGVSAGYEPEGWG